MTCEWRLIEEGELRRARYAIIRCALCGKEAASMAAKFNSEQLRCPLERHNV